MYAGHHKCVQTHICDAWFWICIIRLLEVLKHTEDSVLSLRKSCSSVEKLFSSEFWLPNQLFHFVLLLWKFTSKKRRQLFDTRSQNILRPEHPSQPQLFAWSSTRLIWTFYIWAIRFYSLYCWYILSWPDLLTSQLPLWLWLESAKNRTLSH